jgi:hypothetical protein
MMLSLTQGELDGPKHTQVEIHKTRCKAFAQQAGVKIRSSNEDHDVETGSWPNRISPASR